MTAVAERTDVFEELLESFDEALAKLMGMTTGDYVKTHDVMDVLLDARKEISSARDSV